MVFKAQTIVAARINEDSPAAELIELYKDGIRTNFERGALAQFRRNYSEGFASGISVKA